MFGRVKSINHEMCNSYYQLFEVHIRTCVGRATSRDTQAQTTMASGGFGFPEKQVKFS